MQNQKISLILAGLAACVVSGCGESVPPHPTAAVSGTLTYNGEPIDHGRVVFIQESGPAAATFIESGSQYSLMAPVGENRVMIESHDLECCCPTCIAGRKEGRPGYVGSTDPDKVAARKEIEAAVENGALIVQTPSLPPRFENHMTSGFVINVKEGVDNNAQFDLID